VTQLSEGGFVLLLFAQVGETSCLDDECDFDLELSPGLILLLSWLALQGVPPASVRN
jgi:hypothetical protein